MALLYCRACTTAYAVGVPACPHCQSTDYSEEPVPKITRHGGPSVAGAVVTGGSWGDTDAADAWPAQATGQDTEPDDEETEVPSSPGSSSSASPEKPQTSQRTSARDRRKRAPTTASRSKQSQAEGSAADTTGGDGPKTPSTDETTD